MLFRFPGRVCQGRPLPPHGDNTGFAAGGSACSPDARSITWAVPSIAEGHMEQ